MRFEWHNSCEDDGTTVDDVELPAWASSPEEFVRQVFYSNQCWYGSGSESADPYIRLMDADPDPAIFVSDLPDINKKKKKFSKFFCILLLKVHLHHFSKIKIHKEGTKQ